MAVGAEAVSTRASGGATRSTSEGTGNGAETAGVGAAQPIPVTAWSLVNALGRDVSEVMQNLDARRTGLAEPPASFRLPFPTRTGQAPGDLTKLPEGLSAFQCREAELVYHAYVQIAPKVKAAVARWGASRVAIVLGTSTGGLDATEAAVQYERAEGRLPEKYRFHDQHDFNAVGVMLAKAAGIEGPSYSVSTACSSSGKVFASAQRILRLGWADAVLVGGADSLCHMTLRGFHGLGVLSERLTQPFDQARCGINIGEGAGLMLLEREASDVGLALVGVGESSDGFHMSSPHPEGRGAYEAMMRALADAGLSPEQIGYVNAHGTGTKHNDAAEALALSRVFGTGTPVSSTKGFTGHLLGAAAITEAIILLHVLLGGKLPASLGLETPDSPLSLVPAEGAAAEDNDVRFALSNSFAFGGSNVSLVFGRLDGAVSGEGAGR